MYHHNMARTPENMHDQCLSQAYPTQSNYVQTCSSEGFEQRDGERQRATTSISGLCLEQVFKEACVAIINNLISHLRRENGVHVTYPYTTSSQK
jgi:hypothetical protein